MALLYREPVCLTQYKAPLSTSLFMPGTCIFDMNLQILLCCIIHFVNSTGKIIYGVKCLQSHE